MSLSCPALNGVGLRGGGISAIMKDSGLRRHSTHSIIEGERRVLQSSAPPVLVSTWLGRRRAARAKRFLIPPGPKKPSLGKPPFSRPSLSWVLRRAFMSPAEGERCMRRDEKQGDRPSDCVLAGVPLRGDARSWCVEGWFGESQ